MARLIALVLWFYYRDRDKKQAVSFVEFQRRLDAVLIRDFRVPPGMVVSESGYDRRQLRARW